MLTITPTMYKRWANIIRNRNKGKDWGIAPLSASCGRWAAPWAWALGTFTSTQLKRNKTELFTEDTCTIESQALFTMGGGGGLWSEYTIETLISCNGPVSTSYLAVVGIGIGSLHEIIVYNTNRSALYIYVITNTSQ